MKKDMEKEQHTPEEQIKTAVAICVANLDISKYPSQDQIFEHLLKFVQSDSVRDYWRAKFDEPGKKYVTTAGGALYEDMYPDGPMDTIRTSSSPQF